MTRRDVAGHVAAGLVVGALGCGALGLAVAHGFLTARDAAIEIDDTTGGGATAVISLPAAP